MSVLLVVVAVLAAGSCCVAYGVFIERKWFRMTRYRLEILPAGGPQALRVLHLSDLHYARGDRRMARFIASLPERDVTVITGDLLGEPEAAEEVARILRPARGELASYFVLGSNDRYYPRPIFYLRYFKRRGRKLRVGERGRDRKLVSQLEADGWMHLSNARAELDGIEAAGMDDPHIHRPDLRMMLRRSPERFGLAIVHSPDPAPELAALGYGLIVAGHTHGGQVRMPFVGALVNNSKLPLRMSMGMFRIGSTYLHISPGLGTSKYAPFRFLCRPEATLIELARPRH